MTRTLILIRHAKSDWDDASLSDHNRPLNCRGHRAAPRIGAWLARMGLTPDEVLCSDAMRTRQTWATLSPYLPSSPPPTLLSALYLASPTIMLNTLRKASGNCVAMIAHNPGTASLACALCKTPADHVAFGRYPTAATTVFQFDAPDWTSIEPGTGSIQAFAIPRELPDPE